MTEEDRQLLAEVYQSGLEIDGLIQCLDFLVFEHFPGIDVEMEDVVALHGLTAAFMTLSKSHINDVMKLNEQLGKQKNN